MIHPAWFYLILPGPALPYTALPALSGSAAHARSCPASRDTLGTWLLAPLWTSDQLSRVIMIVNLVITKLDENGGHLETEFARLVES